LTPNKKKKSYSKLKTIKDRSRLLLNIYYLHLFMTLMLYITHPQVVPNLYEFLSSAEHKRSTFEEDG